MPASTKNKAKSASIIQFQQPTTRQESTIQLSKLLCHNYCVSAVTVATRKMCEQYGWLVPSCAEVLLIEQDSKPEPTICIMDDEERENLQFEILKTKYSTKNELTQFPGWLFSCPHVKRLFYFFQKTGEVYEIEQQVLFQWVENNADRFQLKRRKIKEGCNTFFSLRLLVPKPEIEQSAELRVSLNIFKILSKQTEDVDFIQIY